MKRVVLLWIGAFILILQGNAQSGDDIVNIPDTAFLYALIDEGVDTDQDSLITFSEAESVNNLVFIDKGITDMTGIEAFVLVDTLVTFINNVRKLNLSTLSKLKLLGCGSNPIDSLDLSNNPSLFELYANGCNLTYLDLSNNPLLNKLSCGSNPIDSLNLSNNPGLLELWVKGCNLTYVDLSNNPLLEIFSCEQNQLSSLDLSANVNLEALYCASNPLESLDLSALSELEELDCNENPVSNLDLSNNLKLKKLWCSRNPTIDSLDVSKNTTLEELWCNGNGLTSLLLPDSSAIKNLSCGKNFLDSIDVSGCPNLDFFQPWDNNFTSLDLSNNPLLNWLSCEINQLTELDVSNNPELNLLWCGDNLLTTLDLSNNTKIGSSPETLAHLNVDNMPTLGEICVWDSYPGDATISYENSPNVCFEKGAACDGLCPTGIEGFDHSDLLIYPNPTSDVLTIETASFGPHSIQLYSLDGQEIYAETFNGTLQQIDLSYFPKGIYFIHIRSENLTTTTKIVKL